MTTRVAQHWREPASSDIRAAAFGDADRTDALRRCHELLLKYTQLHNNQLRDWHQKCSDGLTGVGPEHPLPGDWQMVDVLDVIADLHKALL